MDKQLTDSNQKAKDTGSQKQRHAGEMQDVGGHHTQVENAHASGVGAMGRNDEKLPSGEEAGDSNPSEPAY